MTTGQPTMPDPSEQTTGHREHGGWNRCRNCKHDGPCPCSGEKCCDKFLLCGHCPEGNCRICLDCSCDWFGARIGPDVFEATYDPAGPKAADRPAVEAGMGVTTRADLIETAARVMFEIDGVGHPEDGVYPNMYYQDAAAILDAVLPQITTAERERIAQELRDHIPPPWGGQADYWKAWWDVADAVEANFFESEEPQPEETPAHG